MYGLSKAGLLKTGEKVKANIYSQSLINNFPLCVPYNS